MQTPLLIFKFRRFWAPAKDWRPESVLLIYYLTPYLVHAAATSAVHSASTVASPAATTSLTVSAVTEIGSIVTNGTPSLLFVVGYVSPAKIALITSRAFAT